MTQDSLEVTQDSTVSAVTPGALLISGNQLRGIRLGPEAADDTPIPGARLDGCLLAVVSEGGKALASDIALQAEESQLVLEVGTSRAAGWSWPAVLSIVADGIAQGPDGNWTQLLEVSTADHTFRFLAPAYRIGSWVSALPDAARECWAALKSDVRRDDVVMGDRDPRHREAVVEDQGSALTEAALTRTSHLGGDEQAMDNENAPEDEARSVPNDGREPTSGTGVAAEPVGAVIAAAPGVVEPAAPGVVEPAAPGTGKDPGSRGARHARRRLFGRSARSDNRHKASSVRPVRRQVSTTQVVKNLLTWNSRSTRPAHAMSGKKAAIHVRVRNWSRQRRIATIAIAVAVAATTAASTAAAFQPGPVKASHATIRRVVGPVAPDWPQTQNLQAAFAPPTKTFRLAKATAKPLPAPPSLAHEPALSSHEIFAFAPYWTLAQESGFNVNDLSTVSYFGLDVNANGTIEQSGDGWTGYQSEDLADLIDRAHAVGTRVVLTVECFDQTTLDELTSDPTAGTTLGTQVVALLRAKNLDGVNVDFEGAGSSDQAGLDSFMARLSSVVRSADDHWQITMDTYASSAGDPDGFYDIQGLAPSVDAFFVMAYQMGGPTGSANGNFSGSNFSAEETMNEYTQAVPASKIILGLPFYGYDWPTTGPGASASATGPATPVSDSQIASSPVYWNDATDTAWTAYKSHGQWHQTWFDDAQSLAEKAQVANSFGARGVGIWTLGMDGNNPELLAALVGNAPVVKEYDPAPSGRVPAPKASGSTTSTTRGRGTTTTTRASSTTTTQPTTTSTTGLTTTTTQPTTTTTSTTTTTPTTEPTTTPTTEPTTTPTTEPTPTTEGGDDEPAGTG